MSPLGISTFVRAIHYKKIGYRLSLVIVCCCLRDMKKGRCAWMFFQVLVGRPLLKMPPITSCCSTFRNKGGNLWRFCWMYPHHVDLHLGIWALIKENVLNINRKKGLFAGCDYKNLGRLRLRLNPEKGQPVCVCVCKRARVRAGRAVSSQHI